jgi:phosphoglycerate dehydrogenase-like enzyme
MRLALTGSVARQPILDALAQIPAVEVVETASVALLAAEAPTADAMILSDPRGADGAILAEALRRPDARTRWVQIVSAGYAGMLAHALPETVVVTNQGGAVANAVAEHAMALVLAHFRGLPAAFSAQTAERWNTAAIRGALRTLEGTTAAILGLGHVGQALAARLAPFGVTVIGVNRDGAPGPGMERTFSVAALDEALGLADIVALCLPASPGTHRLIDAGRIAAMKTGALIVNVGRGEVIDTEALALALVEGRLGGAALDVADPEPLPAGHPLWQAPNLIVTPHVAGGSPLARQRIARMVADNVARFAAGAALMNQVYPRIQR